jgi:hypothetical protein
MSSLAAAVEAFVQLPSQELMKVRVTGTKNFGNEVVFDKEVETRVNSTAGDALGQAAEIEMSGDYVETVAGIKGNQQVYWFYYINGLMSKAFAYGYKLRPGDVENWDFHDWTFYMMGPSAMLGAFPEPCLHGYGGKVASTMVVFAPGFEEEAAGLRDRLTALGVTGVKMKNQNDLTIDEKKNDNLFIIATADQPLIASMNEQFKIHEPVYFSDGKIKTRDFSGNDSQTFGAGYGVLNVIQNPWNPKGSWACQGAVWAITGLDETGVRRAAKVLTGFPKELSHSFALVIGNGEVIKTPVGPGGAKTVAVNTESGLSPVSGPSPVSGDSQTPAVSAGTVAPAQEPAKQDNQEENKAAQKTDAADKTETADSSDISKSSDENQSSELPTASVLPTLKENVARHWWVLFPTVGVAAVPACYYIKRHRKLKETDNAEEQELI